MDQGKGQQLERIATALVRQYMLEDQNRRLSDGSPVRWKSEIGEGWDGVGIIQLMTNDEQRVIAESRARNSESEADAFYQPSLGAKRKPVPSHERAVFIRMIYEPAILG